MLLAGPLAAQEERRLDGARRICTAIPTEPPWFRSPPAPPVEAGKADGDWREVTVEGWIYQPSTSPTKRDGFDLVVTSDEGENLRRAPNGPIVGRAREGTLLERVGEKGKWFRVRRDGWVPREAVPAKHRGRADAPDTAARGPRRPGPHPAGRRKPLPPRRRDAAALLHRGCGDDPGDRA